MPAGGCDVSGVEGVDTGVVAQDGAHKDVVGSLQTGQSLAQSTVGAGRVPDPGAEQIAGQALGQQDIVTEGLRALD